MNLFNTNTIFLKEYEEAIVTKVTELIFQLTEEQQRKIIESVSSDYDLTAENTTIVVRPPVIEIRRKV